MSGPLVIKVGGSTLGNADTSFSDIASLALSGDIPIVVHGGGAAATEWLERMGIESRFERGRRITDANALPVVVAVFGGLVNKTIVTAIIAHGASACGLSGADASLVDCEISEPEFGFVGEPRQVDPSASEALRAAGIVPVIAPVATAEKDGERVLVNVNADLVAGHVAAAVHARELLFLTDVDGVRGPDGEILSSITATRAAELIAEGVVSGGMVPKIESCIHAAGLGVPVRILDGRIAGAIRERESRGTVVVS